MGRSVLARSFDGGFNFEVLYEFSGDRFINVSVERVRNAAIPGLPSTDGDGLVIFGSGRYRVSDVCLAHLPLDALLDRSRSRLRFWKGDGWARDEGAAKPLFCAGCVGELNVRWSHHLARWVVLYNSDNPHGIVVRTAARPWGPWSAAQTLFDPWRSGGYCHFIHRGKTDPPAAPCDHVEDDMMHEGTPRTDEWGDPYGPYQITALTTGIRGRYSRFYFTLSTWNSYQVMLMSAVVPAGFDPAGTTAPTEDASASNDRKYARLSVLLARLAGGAHRRRRSISSGRSCGPGGGCAPSSRRGRASCSLLGADARSTRPTTRPTTPGPCRRSPAVIRSGCAASSTRASTAPPCSASPTTGPTPATATPRTSRSTRA
jgi:hypothetical protein